MFMHLQNVQCKHHDAPKGFLFLVRLCLFVEAVCFIQMMMICINNLMYVHVAVRWMHSCVFLCITSSTFMSSLMFLWLMENEGFRKHQRHRPPPCATISGLFWQQYVHRCCSKNIYVYRRDVFWTANQSKSSCWVVRWPNWLNVSFYQILTFTLSPVHSYVYDSKPSLVGLCYKSYNRWEQLVLNRENHSILPSSRDFRIKMH